MEILLVFADKPKTPSRDNAIKIAEKNKYCFSNGRHKVIFDSINDNLIRLLDISHNWKSTMLYIDNEEIDIGQFYRIVSCYYKDSCKGVCRNYRPIEYYDLSNVSTMISDSEKGGYYNTDRLIRELDCSEIIEKESDNIYKINKDKIKREVNERIPLEIRFCKIINIKKMMDLVDSLPDRFEVMTRQEQFIFDKSIYRLDPEINDERKFTNLEKFEIDELKAKSEIMAEIFAKAIAKELKKLLDENNKKGFLR